MTGSATFSIAVVNYAGEEVLEACVKSVLDTAHPPLLRELIIVDNSGGESAVKRAAALSPLVRVLTLNRNAGYGGGINAAAKVAEGEFLVALNNDTRLPAGWLDEFAALFGRRGERLVACPLLVYATDPAVINSAGTYLSPLGTTGAWLKGQSAAQMPAEVEVPAPTGACVVASKALFLELGGFDESLFMYCEDLDLGWRARRRGIPVVLLSKVKVLHRTAGGRRESARYYELSTRNRLIVIRKNSTGLSKLRTVGVCLMTSAASAALLAARGRAPLGISARALLDGLSTPVPPPPAPADPSFAFRELSWAETFRHLVKQGQAHLS